MRNKKYFYLAGGQKGKVDLFSKKGERGFSLIVVSSLLSVSLFLAVMGAQTAVVNERLAGNYGFHSRANMNSESIGSSRLNYFYDNNSSIDFVISESVFSSCGEYSYESLMGVAKENYDSCKIYRENEDGYDGVSCYISLSNNFCGLDDGDYIAAIGTVGHYDGTKIAEGSHLFIGLNAGGDDSGLVIQNPIEVCNDILMQGSANISGAVFSGGNVTFGGGSAPAEKVVSAGKINTPGPWWESNHSSLFENYIQNLGGDYPLRCDPLSVNDLWETVNDFLPTSSPPDVRIGQWPNVNAWVDNNGLWVWDEQSNSPKSLGNYYGSQKVSGIEGFPSDHEFLVLHAGDFVQQNGEIVVGGERDYLLVVDGDMTMGAGGNRSLVIEDGSSLTVVSSGDVSMNSSLSMKETPLLTNGRPTFSVYSANLSGQEQKFDIIADAEVTGYFYAPFASARVTGSSHIRGGLNFKDLNISGDSTITNEVNEKYVSPGENGSSIGDDLGPGVRWHLL